MDRPDLTFTDDDWLKYAKALLTETNPFNAALGVFANDPLQVPKACFVNANWNTGANQLKLAAITQSLLKDNGIKSFLPTKEAALRRLWELTESALGDIKDKVACVKLMAEIEGWIKKDGPQVSVNVSSNVMVVKDNGDNDSWEQRLKAQQEKLTERNDSAAIH